MSEIKDAFSVQLERIESLKDTLKQDLSDINTSLVNREALTANRFSEVADKIRAIPRIPATIVVTAPNASMNGLTVYCEKGSQQFSEVIDHQSCNIVLPELGTWTLTYGGDKTTEVVVDEYKDYSILLEEVVFKGTIDVSVHNALIGETLAIREVDGTVDSATINTAVTTITVDQPGQYTVYIEDFETYFTQTVNLTSSANTDTVDFTQISSGIPVIINISNRASDGQQIQCSDTTGFTRTKTVENELATFILPATGRYSVKYVDYPTIVDTVFVDEERTYYQYLNYPEVYGVKITESISDPTSRVSYTDAAVNMTPVTWTNGTEEANYNGWEDTWIFKKFYPVMLTFEGVEAYKLNPSMYMYKEDGSASDFTNINYRGNAMVAVETFYTKFSMDGDNECIQICDKQLDGFEPIGFYREDGTIADKIYLPMYLGVVDSQGNLRSIGNQTVYKYIDQHTPILDSLFYYRMCAQQLGEGYDIESWAINQMLQAVYLVLMKSCSPRVLGEGRSIADKVNDEAITGNTFTFGAIGADCQHTNTIKFMHMEDFITSQTNGLMRAEVGCCGSYQFLYIDMQPPYDVSTSFTGTQVNDYDFSAVMQDQQSYAFDISQMKCSNKYGRIPVKTMTYDSNYNKFYYERSDWYHSSAIDSASLPLVSFRGGNYGLAGREISFNEQTGVQTYKAGLVYIPPR